MLVRIFLVIVLAGYAIFTWWFVTDLEKIVSRYEQSQLEISQPSPVPVAIVRFENIKRGLVVPSWSWFETDRLWAYVSKSHPIASNFEPKLVSASVPTGDWLIDDRVHHDTNQALIDLFKEAELAEKPLLISSAFRSANDQLELLSTSRQQYGSEWAEDHIANPAQSEHQLGLAVDITSASPHCQQSFAGCSLRPETANWLADNAHKHGFVLRYPAKKSHITGIAHEPWHYRYVGKYMSQYVKDSELTLDEILIGVLNARTK